MAQTDSLGLSEKSNDGPSSVTDLQEQVFAFAEDRKLGFVSVVFLIINAMMGTGIFSTPSSVFEAVNSVGSALMVWLTGAVLSLSGFVDI
jgi:hypothetical protein